jgi:hypothetical protein
VDYGKIATMAVAKMINADVRRFLIVCALVSDLYCPGYNRTESLPKDSNLARAAVRYRVDTAKVAVAVRAELPKASDKSKNRPLKATTETKPN